MASQLTLTGTPATEKVSRESYTREFKLSVIAFYRQNNLYQTSKKFSLNTKTVLRWAASEEKIQKCPKGLRHLPKDRPAMHPEVEAALHAEFREMRQKGLKVKGYWFKLRARQLLEEKEPGATFQFSNRWFDRFKARHKISLRRPTNTAQTPASDKESLISGFHHLLRREAKPKDVAVSDVGRFSLAQIANMDQTPLPFTFSSGETYADTGDRTVWIRGGASGLDKRQCTVQLTVFADGEPRVKPLLIFKGTGTRIPLHEMVRNAHACVSIHVPLYLHTLCTTLFPQICRPGMIPECVSPSTRRHGQMSTSCWVGLDNSGLLLVVATCSLFLMYTRHRRPRMSRLYWLKSTQLPCTSPQAAPASSSR